MAVAGPVPGIAAVTAEPLAALGSPVDWARPAEGSAVRVALDTVPSGAVDCAFGAGRDRLRLAAVRLPNGTFLPVPRLVVLDRFWIGTDEGLASDPLPAAGADAATVLPRGSGYPLQQLVSALPAAGIYGLLAVAYALVYGLIGRINLSFGAFAVLGGTAAWMALILAMPAGPLLALGAGAAAALMPPALHGAVTARLVFRPLAGAPGQQVLVATVGLGLLLGEGLRIAQGAQPHWIGPLFDEPVALGRDADFLVTFTPVAMVVSGTALLVGVGLAWTMRLSRFGRNWRAFRDDPRAAALFGVDRDRLLAQTVGLAGALAGLAGAGTVLMFGEISFAYAQTLGVKALTAAVLGGIGSVTGAFWGGLAIAVIEAGWSSFFPIVDRDLVTFAILVAMLVWRPGGFFGEPALVPRSV